MISEKHNGSEARQNKEINPHYPSPSKPTEHNQEREIPTATRKK